MARCMHGAFSEHNLVRCAKLVTYSAPRKPFDSPHLDFSTNGYDRRE